MKKLSFGKIILVVSLFFVFLIAVGIFCLAMLNKKPMAAFYGISEKNVEGIVSVLQTTYQRKNKNSLPFNYVILDDSLPLEAALKKSKKIDLLFLYKGLNSQKAVLTAQKKKRSFDKLILDGMSSSIINLVYDDKNNVNNVYEVPLLIDNVEVCVNHKLFNESNVKYLNTLGDLEIFAEKIKGKVIAPIIFSGGEDVELINVFGSLIEATSDIKVLRSFEEKLNELNKKNQISQNDYLVLLNNLIKENDEITKAINLLKKWKEKNYLPSNIYNMTTKDLKAYMNQDLCGISFLSLTTHRTFTHREIEKYTSVFVPSVKASVERTFSSPVIVCVPYSKNKIIIDSVKQLAGLKQNALSSKTGLAPVQKNCSVPDRQADDVRYWVAASNAPFESLSNACFDKASTKKNFAEALRSILR